MTDQVKEREGSGRFATGNPGGPGRPRRRVEAEYLGILSDAVTLPTWRKIAKRAVDDALQGDAAARSWLSRYLVGQVGNTLERLAAAELAGRTVDDGIAEMAAKMEVDATVSKTILTTTDLIRALRDAG
ncbi:MAG: hypothetical protein NTY19_27670 [Planctomycetota bacterium]|nr:hypothetical protein [Planctomycetota bacterium]